MEYSAMPSNHNKLRAPAMFYIFLMTLRRLYNASPPLVITGWLNVALLLASIAVAPFDDRLVMGINPWIKPIKFEVSIVIYVWTVAWLLEYLPRPQRLISWGVSVAMIVEIACIVLQAARGTTSHYNVSTPFDGAVFTVMGVFIVANTLLLARLLWLFRLSVAMPRAILWGVRFGLVLLLMASTEGVVMLGNQAHTVGIADGGPGLPLVNWSTRAGDLRVAHFIGIHGLQILPLAGWLLESRWPRRAVAGVAALFVAALAVFALALTEALAGHPLITM
jgi:hypothetical protein